jgi:hypothetical protein
VNGAVIGFYADSNNVNHGFVSKPNGTLSTFDAGPTNPSNPFFRGTQPFGINPAGTIVGGYMDTANVGHGFTRATNVTLPPALSPI